MTRAARVDILHTRIRALYAKGLTTEAIASRLGCSSSVIRKHARRLNIEPNYPWTADRGSFDL